MLRSSAGATQLAFSRIAATAEDAEPHLLLRMIFEDIAISVAPTVTETTASASWRR